MKCRSKDFNLSRLVGRFNIVALRALYYSTPERITFKSFLNKIKEDTDASYLSTTGQVGHPQQAQETTDSKSGNKKTANGQMEYELAC